MRYLFILLSVFLLSCDKEETVITPPPPEEIIIPHITSWTDTLYTGALRHNVFTYNDQGNPISVTSEHSGSGVEWDYFFYDSLQRLTEHTRVLTHHYLYSGADTLPYAVIEETIYGEQTLAYTYDQEQRIIKVVNELNEETIFAYNSDGNLINGEEYTDKPSIYRTNKWWMLVNLNFSKNATTKDTDLNQWDLPGKVRSAFLGLGAGMVSYHQ